MIFGAGKIGRSFIGQLFGRAGYKVVFIDVDESLVNLINVRQGYRVIIKSEQDEEIFVPNVSAVHAGDLDKVIEEISTAGIMAVSVGKNALEKIIPVIASGLQKRFELDPESALEIILAENMRDAASFVFEKLKLILPQNYPLEQLVGLVETSIGKMVPVMTQADLATDPLVVFAEPYNTLILDKAGFKRPVPEIEGLAPKDNIKAWVDRKAFIHNLGHATAAYFGFFIHPDAIYLYEVLEDSSIYDFTRHTMMQAAEVLFKKYPIEFSLSDLEKHIDDLLCRFQNKALRDTIFRVGMDLPRKLGADDRFMGIIRMAQALQMPFDLIVKAMCYGFFFQAKDEENKLFPADEILARTTKTDLKSVLNQICGLDENVDSLIIHDIEFLYAEINAKNPTTNG